MSDALLATVGPEPPEREPIHLVPTGSGVESMPWPAVVLLVVHPDGPMAYRYASDGTFAGDTWHESREAALLALEREYGSLLGEWQSVPADEEPHDYALGVAQDT